MNPLDEPDIITISPWPTILKYGLIGSTAVILLSVFNYLYVYETFDLGRAAVISFVVSFITLVVYVLVMVFSIKEYRDKRAEGYISLGKAMILSYGSAMVIGVATHAMTILYLLVIDPDFSVRQLERAYETAGLPSGSVPAASVSSYVILSQQAGSFLLGCFVGAVLSLIISAILKKDRPRYAPRQ